MLPTGDMTLLIFYTLAALGLSFLCSLLEAALLSISPSYIVELEHQGKAFAPALRRLKTDIHRPLAAVLSLNTIANTMGAAGVGAQAQALWGSRALAVASGCLTVLILVCSEIIPKTLGAMYCRQLAPFCARLVPMLMWLTWPFVWLSEKLSQRLSSKHGAHLVSREQIAAMARLGEEQGAVEKTESRILNSLLRSASLRAYDIMTPRTVMVSLDETLSVAQAVDRPEVMHFSRLPLWRGQPDEIVGYLLKNELLSMAAKDQLQAPLEGLRRRILVVPESLGVADLFERFLDHREHIALVVDEYGGVAGVVTMEDVIETWLGAEIIDEADAVSDMRDMARRRWTNRAQMLKLSGSLSSMPPVVDGAATGSARLPKPSPLPAHAAVESAANAKEG